MGKCERKPHIVVIPFPAQGHINPLLHLSHKLVSRGNFNIIFVHTDQNYNRISEAAVASDNRKSGLPGEIRFVSFPDGLNPEDDRTEIGEVGEKLLRIFPSKLEEFIKSFNSENKEGQITCVLADVGLSWTLEVAHKLGINGALHWPMAAAVLALNTRWPELQQNGIIDSDGIPLKNEFIQVCPGLAPVGTEDLLWYASCKTTTERIVMFKSMKKILECMKLSDWWLCNSALELEPESLLLFPKLCPIGPLLSTSSQGGELWPEDMTCLEWLDQQEPKLVVYIAFDSFTIFYIEQFRELVFGLQRLSKPVLWVVRSDFTASGLKMEFPNGFLDNNRKIVSWAPQLKVLSHPAVACFVSHRSWNSTMEGLANGVPFLCWPYFAEQPMNKSYICDVWKVGLELEKNENGTVTRDEVQAKVEQLLGDEVIRERALRLKEVAAKTLAEGGNSSRNLDTFINWLSTSKPEEI